VIVHQRTGTDTTISNPPSTAVAARAGWATRRVLTLASHGCIRGVLSRLRWIGAAVGAGLAGLAVTGGATDTAGGGALRVAFAVCLFSGVPACARLRAAR
jgi:hypothetical protein